MIDFYIGGGNSNEHLDKDIKSLKLTKQERDDLTTFMEALTGVIPPGIDDPNTKKSEAR